MLSGCVSNGGSPTQPTDTTPPMITNHIFAVAENVGIGTLIGAVKASDNITVIYYVITAGNPNHIFSINTNGEIINVMRLDHDTTPNYSLNVRVSDAAGNVSNAIITVSITDVDATPSVTTMGVSGIQNSSITLNGYLNHLGTNSDGNAQVNEYGFIYSTNLSQAANLQLGRSGVEKIAKVNANSTGQYNFVLAGFPLCTPHYFRAFAVNDGGTNYGEVNNFPSETFILTGSSDGEQNNLLCPHATASYTVLLSNSLSYSLNVVADSNVSDNVTVYEGNNTEPLYIRAGPFAISGNIGGLYSNIAFAGISNGTRYMALPLSNNSHRVLISNGSDQNQNYSLNLAEYSGTDPETARLPIAPEKMGFYDSTNGPRFFWAHIPPNKGLQVELDAYRGSNWGVRFNHSGSTGVFSTSFTTPRSLATANSQSRYTLAIADDPSVSGDDYRQTNARLIFRFID